MAEIYKTFMAEAEKLNPEGFAKARAERAELAALRKDAERYRWLRDEDGAFEAFTAAYYNAKAPSDIDAALDAAMATGGGAVGAA